MQWKAVEVGVSSRPHHRQLGSLICQVVSDRALAGTAKPSHERTWSLKSTVATSVSGASQATSAVAALYALAQRKGQAKRHAKRCREQDDNRRKPKADETLFRLMLG
jgi:hypothetical protein